jgi:hypothetical protein
MWSAKLNDIYILKSAMFQLVFSRRNFLIMRFANDV